MVNPTEALEPRSAAVTPWVLLLITDDGWRSAVREVCEEAGFGVEIATSARDAVDCLKVMTPSLVVIEERLYRPVPR